MDLGQSICKTVSQHCELCNEHGGSNVNQFYANSASIKRTYNVLLCYVVLTSQPTLWPLYSFTGKRKK